jgi:hypothetical protein
VRGVGWLSPARPMKVVLGINGEVVVFGKIRVQQTVGGCSSLLGGDHITAHWICYGDTLDQRLMAVLPSASYLFSETVLVYPLVALLPRAGSPECLAVGVVRFRSRSFGGHSCGSSDAPGPRVWPRGARQ